MKISPSSLVTASKDQMASDIGGETVILGLTAGRYYGLDQVGARVWQLIQEPTTVQRVAESITSEYDVDPVRCLDDVRGLLQKMLEAGLIEVQSEPPR